MNVDVVKLYFSNIHNGDRDPAWRCCLPLCKSYPARVTRAVSRNRYETKWSICLSCELIPQCEKYVLKY